MQARIARFLRDRLVQGAVLYRLVRISEAAAKLGNAATKLVPSQPWAESGRWAIVCDTSTTSSRWIICTRDVATLQVA